MATEFGRVPRKWWGKAIAAGLLAGLVMGAYMMAVFAWAGLGPWLPLNMIAAAVPAFRPPDAAFGFGSTLAGMGLHLITAAAWGVFYGLLAQMAIPSALRSFGLATLMGLVYGGAVYLMMGRWIGPALSPAIELMPQGHYFIAHVIFGLVTAWVLNTWSRRGDVAVTFAPAASVGGKITPFRR